MVVIVTILRCLAIFFLSGSLFPLLGNDTVFDADPSLLGGCPGSVPLQQEAAAEEPAVATTAVPECLEGSSVDGRNFSETCSMDGTWYLVHNRTHFPWMVKCCFAPMREGSSADGRTSSVNVRNFFWRRRKFLDMVESCSVHGRGFFCRQQKVLLSTVGEVFYCS